MCLNWIFLESRGVVHLDSRGSSQLVHPLVVPIKEPISRTCPTSYQCPWRWSVWVTSSTTSVAEADEKSRLIMWPKSVKPGLEMTCKWGNVRREWRYIWYIYIYDIWISPYINQIVFDWFHSVRFWALRWGSPTDRSADPRKVSLQWKLPPLVVQPTWWISAAVTPCQVKSWLGHWDMEMLGTTTTTTTTTTTYGISASYCIACLQLYNLGTYSSDCISLILCENDRACLYTYIYII